MEEKICTSCGRKKEMYYGLWCPICEKPLPESMDFYNLYRCMYHIEALGNPGYKDRMWRKIAADIQGNDSFIEIYKDWDPEDGDIELLFDTFNIKEESMQFYVSW